MAEKILDQEFIDTTDGHLDKWMNISHIFLIEYPFLALHICLGIKHFLYSREFSQDYTEFTWNYPLPWNHPYKAMSSWEIIITLIAIINIIGCIYSIFILNKFGREIRGKKNIFLIASPFICFVFTLITESWFDKILIHLY